MTLTFDIADDELQIFLAEADEHLQMLDEGLVRLEREGDDLELLQAIFRAAHTLKGSAGVIGHKRMADLTHAMETVLDGVRKGTLNISTALVDACLESLDALKLLRNEVVEREANPVDIASLVERLSSAVVKRPSPPPPPCLPSPAAVLPLPILVSTAKPVAASRNGKKRSKPAAKSNGRGKVKLNGNGHKRGATQTRFVARRKPQTSAPPEPEIKPGILIQADIAADSMASAARAFQILMALQSLGEVQDLQPSQDVIETAAPVRQVTARLITGRPKEEIRKALAEISELERAAIDGEEVSLVAAASPPSLPPPAPTPTPAMSEAYRLGEMLVEGGHITRQQLNVGLQAQTIEPSRPHLLGETLVKMGAISQEALDRVIVQQVQQLRSALQAATTDRGGKAHAAEKTVRTSVERLDTLMNLVGELITDRNRLYQIRADLESRFHNDEQVDNLTQTVIHVGRITDQLQEEVMRIRMLPMANVFNKFPRLVRDVARKAGKQVELVIRGEDTELDRSVIEEIGDPLIHLLRNAVDHGIESPADRLAAGKPERGTVLLTARHEESRIILTIEDDGKGIDIGRVKASAVQKGLITEAEAAALSTEEAVDLIFKPGLSTAKIVSDISGRGVGMDIVRTNIERLNGSVLVETWPGRGSRFQIVLPLTLAIIPALLVQVGGGTFAIPLVTVMETLRVAAGDIKTIYGKPVTQLRDRVLPLVRLSQSLGFRPGANGRRVAHEYVVAVRWGKLEMGLMVDRLVGEQEMVIKSLGTLMGDTTGVSGAAILGDGRVALIVDVPSLFKLAGA